MNSTRAIGLAFAMPGCLPSHRQPVARKAGRDTARPKGVGWGDLYRTCGRPPIQRGTAEMVNNAAGESTKAGSRKRRAPSQW